MQLLSLVGFAASFLVSIWAFFKFVAGQSYRLDDNLSKSFIDKIIKDARWKVELTNEFSLNKKYPFLFTCFGEINGVYFFFSRNERLLNAGWQSKEVISEIFFLRWQKTKMTNILKKLNSLEENINVMMLQPYGTDKIGEIGKNDISISLDEELYKDIEEDIRKTLEENITKTGCLLYGKPGTGKTRLVKYFAQKFNLPIFAIYLNPDYHNIDILTIFSGVPERCIVLLEDFDNYFDKRKCIMKNDNVKFTFDSLLNGFDGVYNNYKSVVFIMTANDIEKIDEAIKHRSSRFKFVREIKPPSYAKRLELIGDEELARLSDGLSMDKIYFIKDLVGKYNNNEIMEKVNMV